MKISQIIDKIDERQLFVPAFQREYVWKRPDAKNLIPLSLKIIQQEPCLHGIQTHHLNSREIINMIQNKDL